MGSESEYSRRYSSTTFTTSSLEGTVFLSLISLEIIVTCTKGLPDIPNNRDWLARFEDFAESSAQSSLFPGDYLHPLATYVKQPSTHHDTPGFAILYDFDEDQEVSIYDEPAQLNVLKDRNAVAKSQHQLLFLRGHPSPEWIAAIGDTFDVDPSFMYHHLGLFSRTNTGNARSSSILASQSASRPCLRLITCAALHNPAEGGRSERYMHDLRARVDDRFSKYLKDTQTDLRDVRVGESLLRNISVHDADHVTFEQNISIRVTQSEKGWLVLAWLDVGLFGLGDGAHGKFLHAPLSREKQNGAHQENTLFYPVAFVPRPVGSMDPKGRAPTMPGFERHATICQQNALHLCRQYGDTIDQSFARFDSFYAASTLFAFCAGSISQSLDMIHNVVRNDIHKATLLKLEDVAHTNLLCNQVVLSEYVSYLRDILFAIESRSAWPCAQIMPPDVDSAVESIRVGLLNDYNGLLRRTRDISAECDRGIRKVEHFASQAGSKRAHEQATGVERLKRLAFVFFPMQFTAAFFGMNFKQFGQGPLHLWIWAAVTIPIVLISLMLMASNIHLEAVSRLFPDRRRRNAEEVDIELGNLD